MANQALKLLILVLTILVFVSRNSSSSEMLQAALQQIPETDVFAEIPHQADGDGTQSYESEESLFDLWTKIEAAFRFLEQQSTNAITKDKIQEYFRGDKTLEKVKALPLIRHHFIRFGKRSEPS
ncbi:hypothetical protein BsWGS_07251 [Bradybaena similaris]